MQLKQLLASTQTAQVEGSLDRDITSVCYDSRLVKPGALFVALRGEVVDGRRFIEHAVANGALAIVSEEREHQSKATRIVVEQARVALADIAAEFYRHPSHALKTTGITGTNGKTTTAFLLKHLCDTAGLRCGLIGTVRYEIGDRILPATRTTPEALELQDLLYQIRSAGCKAVAMEVSSHALMQERVRNIEFDVAVFTNLTQDHLDYHKTMDAYFEAKSRLFTGLLAQMKKKGKAVVNLDDRHGAKLAMQFAKELAVTTFGVGMKADLRASNLRVDFSGTSYQLDCDGRSYLVRLPLIGRFNVYNSLAAIGAARALGIDTRAAVLALAHAPCVPGRLEEVAVKRQFKVFVDYAHTDDALLNVMRTLRELSPRRLIVVFGCGGNRDRAKRLLMGAAVDQHADHAIVTSDNPRKEDPEAIIADILKGTRAGNCETIVDRREAIHRAIAMAQPRDIILIAGKGHESTQEFADYTIPFDDVAVAQEALAMTPVEMSC